MKLILLSEAHNQRVETVGRHSYLSGVMLEGNVVNRNGRFYDTKLLEREVDAYQTKIKNRTSFSELGHSTVAEPTLERACGIVESLRQNENQFVGRIKLLDTPYGSIAKALVKDGCVLGASSKGFGSLKKHGNYFKVAEDYSLKGIDICGDPSAPNASLSHHMSECIKSGSLSLTESVHAMRALQALGHPELIAQQQKYGYDWDNKAGNQFPGHQGFSSVDDARTYLERLNDDMAMMLANLLKLQGDINIDDTGLTSPSINKYEKMVDDPVEVARRIMGYPDQKKIASATDERRREMAKAFLDFIAKRG